MQAEEAALLAVDMAAAERRIRSSLDTHISELRQQVESEQRAELSRQIQLQVRPSQHAVLSACCMLILLLVGACGTHRVRVPPMHILILTMIMLLQTSQLSK